MCQQLPTKAFSFFIRACFHSKKLNRKFGADWLIFVETGREKPGGSEFHPPQLKWGKSNIHRGHIMVLYFKGKCTHFSPLSATTPICL